MKRILFLLVLVTCNRTYAQADGYCRSGTISIHYKSFGHGTPVLIINGGPGMNSEGFASLAKELSANCNAIIFDQRGTGSSIVKNPDTKSITMDLMVQDMEALRVHLKIDRWLILGHSFGGMLASYYATKYPERTTALILSSSGGIDLGLFKDLDITARLSAQERDSVKYWTDVIAAGDTSHFAKLKRGTFLAPAYVYDKKNAPVIAERLTQSNMATYTLVWADLQRMNFNCAPALKNYHQPVLLIQGKEDIISETTVNTARAALPQARVVFMDHCGHYGWLDNPAVYFGTVKKFIRDNGKTG